MKLWEIDMEVLSCISEDGEVIDFEKLEALECERSAKIENILLWIKNLKAEAEAVKNEKMNLAKRQQTLENKADSLEKFIANYLGGNKFETPKAVATFRKSTSVDVNLEELMQMENYEDYVTFAEPKPNKSAIKDAIKNGTDVKGCSLVENLNLIIK